MMVDRIGSRYGIRPSEILGIDDKLLAFQFDYAIVHFATQIEQGVYRNPKLLKKKQEDGFSKLRFAKMKADTLKGVKHG